MVAVRGAGGAPRARLLGWATAADSRAAAEARLAAQEGLGPGEVEGGVGLWDGENALGACDLCGERFRLPGDEAWAGLRV
jgi:hypothetical protein